MQGDKNNYNMTFKQKLFFFFLTGRRRSSANPFNKNKQVGIKIKVEGRKKKVNHKKINSIEILIVTDKETDLEKG